MLTNKIPLFSILSFLKAAGNKGTLINEVIINKALNIENQGDK